MAPSKDILSLSGSKSRGLQALMKLVSLYRRKVETCLLGSTIRGHLGREGGREKGREGGRKGGREGGWKGGGREGGREGGRVEGREEGREKGREGGREKGRSREVCKKGGAERCVQQVAYEGE